MPNSSKTPTKISRSERTTKRTLSTDEQARDPGELRQPNERDESADQQATPTRPRIKQGHDDVQSGQQDTDCRNRVSEQLPESPMTPENFEEKGGSPPFTVPRK